jgi:hypothetical protein
MNKESDTDWFTIQPSDGGKRWSGKCWYVHNYIKYEFDFQFEIPAMYPAVAPEIELPELEGKTAKMYRGGKICLTIHFKPLWAKNRWAAAAARAAGPLALPAPLCAAEAHSAAWGAAAAAWPVSALPSPIRRPLLPQPPLWRRARHVPGPGALARSRGAVPGRGGRHHRQGLRHEQEAAGAGSQGLAD